MDGELASEAADVDPSHGVLWIQHDRNWDHLYGNVIPHKGHPGTRNDDVAVQVKEIT